jgi:thiol:disulfide interchange protein DsbD
MSRYALMIITALLLFVNAPVFSAQEKAKSLEELVLNASAVKLNLFSDELLQPEQAFEFSASIKDGNTLYVNWEIAPNYYLYREKIKLELRDVNGVKLGDYSIPNGLPKNDEAFGKVEIFYEGLNFDVPLLRENSGEQTLTLVASFQGCADRGVCYPPMTKEVALNLPVAQTVSALPEEMESEQNQIVSALTQGNFALTLISFLGFGVLLAFTPCIFPMIPILSGIIVGQRGTQRAFLLSLSYVVASSLMYTVFGVLAAIFGQNLQMALQNPWVISVFSGVFVVLALSMFDFFTLGLPEKLTSKLYHSSHQHHEGFAGAAMMGALSSLIVGPCVAPPLAGALIYIGQTGDVLLGGAALFMLGLGMGLPLLLLGVSAQKYLPKAGAWLNSIKKGFGVVMLGMAIWLLSRILPAPVTLLLWAIWLIMPAIYLNALDTLPETKTAWQVFWKSIGVIMLIYGTLMLVGVSLGHTNPLKPLANTQENHVDSGLAFERVTSVDELEKKLAQASQRHQSVMLDFYADWCISCKEMESQTFTDKKVKQALMNVVLLQVDVTHNTEADKALLAHFNLVGPPAILFFNDKQEDKRRRVIGYQDATTFLSSLHLALHL